MWIWRAGLYRAGGVHLSDVGVDLFNLGLQFGIEMATVVGVGRSWDKPAGGDCWLFKENGYCLPEF